MATRLAVCRASTFSRCARRRLWGGGAGPELYHHANVTPPVQSTRKCTSRTVPLWHSPRASTATRQCAGSPGNVKETNVYKHLRNSSGNREAEATGGLDLVAS